MKLGRPLEFDPDATLEKAMPVFWICGYEATSLQNLLDAMDLSKSSFYQVFVRRQAFAIQAMYRTLSRLFRSPRLRESLNPAPSGCAFIERCLRSLAEEARGPNQPRGRLIMDTATEFAGRDQ